MKIKTIYNKLNDIANQLNIKIIKGKGNFKGGSCVYKEENIIVLNHNKPIEDRVRYLAFSLLEFNLDTLDIESKIEQILQEYQYIKENT
tara:strand:+ start:388 stop:654 length:267 start_codon:yes stop_codon:yes gene_type:complete